MSEDVKEQKKKAREEKRGNEIINKIDNIIENSSKLKEMNKDELKNYIDNLKEENVEEKIAFTGTSEEHKVILTKLYSKKIDVNKALMNGIKGLSGKQLKEIVSSKGIIPIENWSKLYKITKDDPKFYGISFSETHDGKIQFKFHYGAKEETKK